MGPQSCVGCVSKLPGAGTPAATATTVTTEATSDSGEGAPHWANLTRDNRDNRAEITILGASVVFILEDCKSGVSLFFVQFRSLCSGLDYSSANGVRVATSSCGGLYIRNITPRQAT